MNDVKSPLICVCLIALSCSQVAHGADSENTFTARGLAMGGAQRALPYASAGVELNPAVLAMGGDYLVDLEGGLSGGREEGAGRLLLIDSMTRQEFALGLSVDYRYLPGTGLSDGWVTEEDFTYLNEEPTQSGRNTILAFAFPINPYRTHFGVSVKTVRRSEGGEDPQREFTTDVGVYFQPSSQLSLALVGNNLARTEYQDMPTTLALGVGLFLHPQITIAVDGLLDFTSYSGVAPAFNGGFEATAADVLPIRAGFYRTPDPLNGYRNYLTAGIGLTSSTFSVDYGVRMLVDELGQETDNVGGWFYHMLSLSLSFRTLQAQ